MDYYYGDFPEIYFNILSIKKRKLGVIWKDNQDIEKLIKKSKSNISSIIKLYEHIKHKYGTLDGIKYSCKLIIEDFLKRI